MLTNQIEGGLPETELINIKLTDFGCVNDYTSTRFKNRRINFSPPEIVKELCLTKKEKQHRRGMLRKKFSEEISSNNGGGHSKLRDILEQNYDCEIWAIGCIVYYLCTRKHAFSGFNK